MKVVQFRVLLGKILKNQKLLMKLEATFKHV